jgi:lipoate-protein ligase A
MQRLAIDAGLMHAALAPGVAPPRSLSAMTMLGMLPLQSPTSVEVATAEAHLARTEALWRAVASGEVPLALRWYTYAAPAVVLGTSQPMAVVDEEACRRAGVAVVRRTSGGTAVLASADLLALDVALPADHPLAGGDVVEAYRWLGAAFAAACRDAVPAGRWPVRLVSIDEARADQRRQRSAGAGSVLAARALACFGTLSPYEVAVQKHGQAAKLVGLAQVRKRGVVLYQAGLYLQFSGVHLASLLAVPQAARPALAAELERRVASLADLGLAPDGVPELIRRVHAIVQDLVSGQGA